jgi:hypothetical protein
VKELQPKHKRLYTLCIWLLTVGGSGLCKGLQGNIRQHAKPIVESVPKYVKHIQTDKVNFDIPEALENEVLAIMACTAKGQFTSNSYPRIKPTVDNLRKYGIKSTNSYIALIQVFISTLKDTVKAIRSHDIKNATITDKYAHLTAGQIARKYGYYKGRIRNPLKRSKNDILQADFVSREISLDTECHNIIKCFYNSIWIYTNVCR